jgi:hypothetical protein
MSENVAVHSVRPLNSQAYQRSTHSFASISWAQALEKGFLTINVLSVSARAMKANTSFWFVAHPRLSTVKA